MKREKLFSKGDRIGCIKCNIPIYEFAEDGYRYDPVKASMFIPLTKEPLLKEGDPILHKKCLTYFMRGPYLSIIKPDGSIEWLGRTTEEIKNENSN